MSEIIELIKVLRDRTGAGMMDCKHALEANENDVEKSINWLREKGIAKAAKKQGRIAAEGLTIVKYCDKCHKAVVLEINCETDFVAGSDAFKELVQKCAQLVLENSPKTIEEAQELVKSLFDDAALKLGEKLSFRRFEIIEAQPVNGVGTYIHMGGKISVLTVLASENPEIAKGISMTIAATQPVYVAAKDIPADVVAAEREVQVELAKNDEKLKGKPEAALAKILDGKVAKALSSQVLLEQEYVLDPTKTVEQVLKENNNSVVKFVRYQVGEGLEKRHDDFAAEVAAQAK